MNNEATEEIIRIYLDRNVRIVALSFAARRLFPPKIRIKTRKLIDLALDMKLVQMVQDIFRDQNPLTGKAEIPCLRQGRTFRRFNVDGSLTEDTEGRALVLLEFKETKVEQTPDDEAAPVDERYCMAKIGIIRGYAETLLEYTTVDQGVLKRALISIHKNAEALEKGLPEVLKRSS